MQQVSLQTRNCCFLAELNNGVTSQEIVKQLPVDAIVSTWGDEIYFELEVTPSYDTAKLTSELEIGDVAYWPQGRCICVFFGLTPISKAGKPLPASPVVVIGKTKAIPIELRRIKTGDALRVIQVQENVLKPASNTPKAERRLTQAEIDVLVQQLLTEKTKQALGVKG